ncbi:MAG: carbohydrate ABC transporter permease [Victivallaceae bacterium]|nr:carbohydrate ABC transporter permease [Victivallaceae bacterium]
MKLLSIYKTKTLASEIQKHLFILGILAMAMFPFYVMLTISGKTNAQFAGNPWTLMMPFHFENYGFAWNMVSGYIFNTIFIAVTSVVLTFFLTLNGAFFFARFNMPGKNFFWYFFLILMLMPAISNLIPLFMLLKTFNLLNTFLALIVVNMAAGQVVQIYILRNFIEDIPQDLFDAAEVDGASMLRQVYTVVLPMSGSILSTLGILQFIRIWNNYILPMIILRDDNMLTLSVGLVRMDSEYVKEWGQLMAGYTIASIPLIIIFLFTMRLFVKGLSSGAVKG